MGIHKSVLTYIMFQICFLSIVALTEARHKYQFMDVFGQTKARKLAMRIFMFKGMANTLIQFLANSSCNLPYTAHLAFCHY
jgi:hypothetical protein